MVAPPKTVEGKVKSNLYVEGELGPKVGRMENAEEWENGSLTSPEGSYVDADIARASSAKDFAKMLAYRDANNTSKNPNANVFLEQLTKLGTLGTLGVSVDRGRQIEIPLGCSSSSSGVSTDCSSVDMNHMPYNFESDTDKERNSSRGSSSPEDDVNRSRRKRRSTQSSGFASISSRDQEVQLEFDQPPSEFIHRQVIPPLGYV